MAETQAPVTAPPTMSIPMRSAVADGLAPDRATIGVSVELPDPEGRELQRWRAAFGDPLAHAIPVHVTLLPPTEVPLGIAGGITRHLATVARATRPFTIRLRGTGSFRPVSPVVFVRLAEGVEGCDALQRRIRTGPLRRELSFPYHPHVTVAHHLPEAALDRAERTLSDYACDFEVTGIGVYEHGPDGVWRLQRRFGFAGSPE